MAAVPRRDYLPRGLRRYADVDQALDIGHRQTCSQPSTVRTMLELLDVRPGQRVLDVGSGSGWTTALLAHLVGPTGSVTGVELVPALTALGATHLAAADVPWARILQAREGTLGRPEGAPYDRVLVSAEGREVPAELLSQLTAYGVMVLPVAGELLRVIRRGEEEPQVQRWGSYRFVPLRRTADT